MRKLTETWELQASCNAPRSLFAPWDAPGMGSITLHGMYQFFAGALQREWVQPEFFLEIYY